MLFLNRKKKAPLQSTTEEKPSPDDLPGRKVQNEIEKARQDLMLAQLEAMRDQPDDPGTKTPPLPPVDVKTDEPELPAIENDESPEPVIDHDPGPPQEPDLTEEPAQTHQQTPVQKDVSEPDPVLTEIDFSDSLAGTILREIVAEDIARRQV